MMAADNRTISAPIAAAKRQVAGFPLNEGSLLNTWLADRLRQGGSKMGRLPVSTGGLDYAAQTEEPLLNAA